MGWLLLCSILCLHLFVLSSLSCCFAFPSCHTDQSSALLGFKNSISVRKPDPSYPGYRFCYYDQNISYPKTLSWGKGTNCCLWDGVTCNTLGHVIGLNLSCSRLHGEILPNNSLFQLTHLKRLYLSNNDFQESHISPNFSQLVGLTHLYMSFSNLSGEVPLQISHLHKLVSLDLSWNSVYLSIKPHTWEKLVKNLTRIKELRLNYVDMSLIPPAHLLNNLSSSLVFLGLRDTRLQGNLVGKIPSFPRLQEIILSSNINLTGYFLNSDWSNSLRTLIFSRTNFTGELPHSIGQMKLLKKLLLSSCQFGGKIPASFWNLTQLTNLDLSNNNFSGQISSSISNLQNLITLNFSSNNFCGQIPSSISKLKNLEFLDLSYNGFQGHLPNEIPTFPFLRRLYLSHNLLNGTIPSWCFNLPSLEWLDISHNLFTGQIDEVSSYSLRQLDISNNKLYGSIPRSILYLENLTLLNLSHNFLTETLQFHHLSWKNMHYFDLSSNLLQGELTSSICNASSLEILNLSHNHFTGTIPHCIGSSSLALSILDLQRSSFSGTIPETFEVANNLRTLNLNGNIFNGLLPQSLVNCTKLRVLDLGRNVIEDTFPYWLQVLDRLQVLVLRENKLHGSIPNFKDNKTSHAFPKLRVFDLSSNNFRGPLPVVHFESFEAMKNADKEETSLHYLSYENSGTGRSYHDSIEVTMKGLDIHLEKILTVFTTIDLSNNMFEGEIPQVIGELGALKGINFSHNRLTGAIPSSMGNLRNLEWLDLSSNNFNGKIPAGLTELNFLSILNLSKNQLEGCIPRGPQFETFTSDSFKENKGLHGFPLTIQCITHEERQSQPSSKIRFEFGWKPVVWGYACGATFGATIGWIVIKPLWIASMLNDLPGKRRRKVRNHGS